MRTEWARRSDTSAVRDDCLPSMEVYHLRGRLSDARGGKTGYTPAAFAERKTLAYHPAHETLLASNRDHLYFCARANLVKGVFGDDFGQQEHR